MQFLINLGEILRLMHLYSLCLLEKKTMLFLFNLQENMIIKHRICYYWSLFSD